jgi:hypothetical protein
MNDLLPLDRVFGRLLETWGHRYKFTFDLEKRELALSVQGFDLLASESGGTILLAFEEAGQKHRVECSVEEAPKVIEALLFPES